MDIIRERYHLISENEDTEKWSVTDGHNDNQKIAENLSFDDAFKLWRTKNNEYWYGVKNS